jgi:hypothetical protein
MADDIAPIPLADDAFTCAVCNVRFVPRGGEMTCPACADRVRARTTAASAGHHGQATLMDDSPLHAAGVVSHALLVAAAGGVALLIVLAHWWSGWFDSWGAVAAWGAFAFAAFLLASPVMSPPRREARAPRWIALVAALGALLTGAALAMHPLFHPPLAMRALLDVLAIAGALAFGIAASLRLTEIAAWTGYDPSEGGLLAQAGPFFLAVFVVSMAFLMTRFFLRELDACDAFAAGFAAWLIWRALVIAWQGYQAGASRVSADTRAKRQILPRARR